ncbi:DUF6455 family protein [Pseudothioclava nitratireducens]|uniref:DUF6455 family protein n=1 Tax=Pseudothioclava nitratireducens TaxID=1928646 RepID=UPI0023DCD2D7|nr:DUF6455 family protein [Defluviimonas nitratireducens]
MGVQGNIDLHFWLTRGLARRLGVNITESIHHGFLTQADFADLITRCRGCSRAQGCMAFLSENDGPLASAPDWCPNAPILGELRALH